MTVEVGTSGMWAKALRAMAIDGSKFRPKVLSPALRLWAHNLFQAPLEG